MAKKVRIEGVQNITDNLNREVSQIEGASMKGLMKAGLRIQRGSQQLTPVATGNLKASAYTRSASDFVALESGADNAGRPSGGVPPDTVEVGYSAAYAAAVHEDLEAYHRNGQAKFLESSLSRNRDQILKDIKDLTYVGT